MSSTSTGVEPSRGKRTVDHLSRRQQVWPTEAEGGRGVVLAPGSRSSLFVAQRGAGLIRSGSGWYSVCDQYFDLLIMHALVLLLLFLCTTGTGSVPERYLLFLTFSVLIIGCQPENTVDNPLRGLLNREKIT